MLDFPPGVRINILLVDWLAFFSLAFVTYIKNVNKYILYIEPVRIFCGAVLMTGSVYMRARDDSNVLLCRTQQASIGRGGVAEYAQ